MNKESSPLSVRERVIVFSKKKASRVVLWGTLVLGIYEGGLLLKQLADKTSLSQWPDTVRARIVQSNGLITVKRLASGEIAVTKFDATVPNEGVGLQISKYEVIYNPEGEPVGGPAPDTTNAANVLASLQEADSFYFQLQASPQK